jgi:hypothetical protein
VLEQQDVDVSVGRAPVEVVRQQPDQRVDRIAPGPD